MQVYDDIIDAPDPDNLMTLPPPSQIWKTPPSPAVLYKAAARFYGLWIDLLNGDFGYEKERDIVKYRCYRCSLDHECSRGVALQRLLMIVGCMYGYFAHQLVTYPHITDAVEKADAWDFGVPGCSAHTFGILKELRGSTGLEWSKPLLENFVGVLQSARILYLARRQDIETDMHNDDFERILADSTLGVFHTFERVVTPEGNSRYGMEAAMLARRIMGYSLHLQCSVFRWPTRPWSETHSRGPFSLLRLPELQLLASQDPRMQQRYGPKQVEKNFELQLALLMQSFGFYVIRTRVGERTVDLICISGDPTASYTLMVEAKTSKAPYAMPTKDERALIEYVATVQESLTTSPKLGMVLVVGSAATRGLAVKLRRIENATGVAARFCTAQELATLRESILGPLSPNLIRRELLTAPHVVSESCMNSIIEEVNMRASAQEALVKTFLGSGTPYPS
jgi:hypothetical protein